jgi:hypothetical protein
MTPVDVIKDVVNSKGKEFEGVEILPGLSDDEITKIKNVNGLDDDQFRELIDLLRVTRGINAGYEFDFTGLTEAAGKFDIGKNGMAIWDAVDIGSDGCGNTWIGEIFNGRIQHYLFLCHDPSIIVYESETLSGFLQRLFTTNRRKCGLGCDDGNWNKADGGGVVKDGNIQWDLSHRIPGSSVPLYVYYDKIDELARDGTNLRFSLPYHQRNWWQRFRDKWR